jgi:beta-glucanase (GH16 family)
MNKTATTRSRTKTAAARKPAARAKKSRPVHIHVGILSAVLLVLSVFMYVQAQRIGTAAGLPAAPSGKVWQQVWNDEFNDSSVDTSKWNVQANSNFGAANHEDECYRAANVSEAGGTLRLTGKRETVTCNATNPETGNNTYYFTSGMVTTRAQDGTMKYKFKQGYIEARVKAPKGNPYWPAFWLVSPNDGSTPGWPDYGEFDIFELYGARPDISNGAFHYKCTTGDGHCKTAPSIYNIKADSAYGGSSNLGTQITNQAQMDAYSGGTTDYNTYGFLWENNRITWFVNGRKVRYFDGTSLYRIEQSGALTLEGTTATLGTPAIPFSTVFGYDHSIILNMAIGGDGPRYSSYGYTGIDTAGGYNNGNLAMQNPGVMEVDYVRVYQLADVPVAPPTPTPMPTPTPTPTPASSPSSRTDTLVQAPASEDGPADNEKVTVVGDDQTVSGAAVLSPELATNKEVQAKVHKVEYYIDNKLQQTVTSPPYRLDTSKVANGRHKVTEKVYFKDGTTTQKTATISIKNTAAITKTAAPWKGVAAAGIVLAVVALFLYMLVTPRGKRWSAALLQRFARN